MAGMQKKSSNREDIYRLLAVCYYSPGAAFFEEQCCGLLAALLEQSLPDAAGSARTAADFLQTTTPEALAVEHARLFIGPFQLVAPPYGSIYLDDAKTVMGESTAQVAAFYRANGLQLADDFMELPDHIAVELEFLSFLAFRQREAQMAGDKDKAAQALHLQREFLGRFLLPWLEPFTTAIINDGEAPFYLAIARCSAAFITADYTALTAQNNA